MSASLLGWAYRQKTGSATTKSVFIKLVDNANDGGYCFPAVKTIAAHLEMHPTTVREHIAKLAELGLLRVLHRTSEGVNLSNHYQLEIEATSSLGEIDLPPRGIRPEPIPPSVQDVGGIRPGRRGVSVQDVTEPLALNPQEKPQGEPSLLAGLPEVKIVLPIEQAVKAFNEAATRCPKWTACRQLTAQRKKIIEARLRENGLAGWARAVELAAASRFLGGPVPQAGDHRNWRMDIAWFAKAENFAKIVEGKYPPSDGNDFFPDRPLGMASAALGLQDFLDSEARH